MPELKRILSLHGCNGWKWYAWLFFITFKISCICSQTKFAIDVIQNDFMLFSYAASTYFIPLLGLSKLYSWLKHHLKIKKMHFIIEEKFWDLNMINDKDLSKRLISRLSAINKIVTNHVLISVLFCTIIAVFPLVQYPDGRKKQPSALWFSFDTDKTPIYQIIYTSLTISNLVSVMANLNFDILYVYFTQNVAVQYVLLKHMLRHVTDVPQIVGFRRYDSEKYQRIIKSRLRICIDHHNLLMRFSRDIQDIYSFCLAVQLILSILSLVFTAFILSMDHYDIVKILKLLTYASALTVQVLLYNLNGSEVEKQHETVAISAFQCEWFYGNETFKHGLLLLMMRSQKEFVINALGLAQVNNACIVMIYKTVFSILTLIKKVIQ